MENLKNEKGHVVGHKERLRDARTGEEFEEVTHYAPLYDAKGDIIGYQEAARGVAVIRGLDGRRIGARYRLAQPRLKPGQRRHHRHHPALTEGA